MEVEVRKFSMLKTALNKIMHTCQFCPKSFSRPSHLTRHLRVHTGEKPFFCFVCGKGFKQSNHLTSHAKIHHKSTDNNNNNNSSTSINHTNSLTTSLLSVEPSLPNLNSSTSFLSGVLDEKYNNSATPISIQSSVSFTNESLLTSSQLKKETDLSLNDAECVVVMDDYDDRQEEEVEEEDEDLIFSEPIATGLKRSAPNFVSQQLQLPNFKKDLSMSKTQQKRNPVSVELLTTSLKCELCTEEFMNYNSLRIHLETHTLSSPSSSPLMAIKSLPRRRNMNGFSFRDYLSQRTVSVSEDGQLQVQSKENLELEEHGTNQVWLKPDKDSVGSVSSREVVDISSSEEKIFHPVDTVSDSDDGNGDDDDDVVIIKPYMDSEINVLSSKGNPQSAELDPVRLGQSSDITVMSDGKQQQAHVLHSRDFNENLSKPPTSPPTPPPFLKENNRSKSRLSPPNLRLLEKILSGENIDQSHLNTLSSTSSSSSLSLSSSSLTSTSQLLSVKHQLFTRIDSNRNDCRDHHHLSPSRLSSRDKLTTRPSWVTANPSTISSNKRRYQNLSSEPSGTANTTTATTNTSTDTAVTNTTKSITDTPQMPDPITSNKINAANIPQNRTLFSSTIPENSSQTSFSRSSSKLVPHRSTSFNASSHTTSVQQQRRREGHRSLSAPSVNNKTNSNPLAKIPLTTNRQQITNNNNNSGGGSGSSFLAFKNQHQIFQSRIKKPHLNTFGFGLYQNRNRFLSGISSQNRFRCKYCPKAFSRPSHLARHTRVHTGEKPFKCRYCSKQFRQSNHLTTHVRIHTDLKPFQQQQQQQNHHSNKNNKAQLNYRPYECQLCGHTFSLLEHLNEHLQSHVADFGCQEQQGDNNNSALLMPNPNQNSVVIDDEASSSQHSIVEVSKPPPPLPSSSLQDSLDISVSKSRSTEQSLLHPSVLYVNKLSEVSERKDSKCVEVFSDNGSIIEITKNFDSSDEEDTSEEDPNSMENNQVSAGNSFNEDFIDPCTNQVWSLQTEDLDSKTSLSVSVSSPKEFHEQTYIPEGAEWKHEINSDSTDNQSVECGRGGDSVTDHISLSLSEIQSSLKIEAEPDEEFGTGSSARFTQNKVPSPSSPRGTEYQADGYVIKIKEEPLDEEEIEEDMATEEEVLPQNGKSPSPGYKYATDNNAARKFLEKDAADDFHDNHVQDINFEDNASRQFLEKDAADDFYGNRIQNIKTEACDIVDLGNTYPLSIHEQNILKKVLQTSARVLKEDLQRFTELKLNMQHSAELENRQNRADTDHRQNRADTDHRQNRDVGVSNYNVAPHTDYFDTQSGIKCDYCNKYFDNLNLFSIHIKSHFTDNQSFFQEDSPSSSLRFNQNFHSKQAPPPSSPSSSTTAQNTLMANVSSTEGGIKPSSDKSSYPYNAAASPSWSKKKAAAMKENKAKPATTSATAKKPMFSCSYCEKSFSRPSHLTRHIRIHTGEKPFKCDICDKSFTQSNHLTSHLKIHSERKLPDYITSLQAFSILTSQFEAQPSRKRAASWYTDPADRSSNSSYNQKQSSENSNGLETLNTTTTTSTTASLHTTTASTAFTTMTTTTTTRTTSSNSTSSSSVGVQREITAANHDTLLTPSKEIDKVSPNLSPDDPSPLSELPGVNHGTVDGLSELREEHSGLTSLYNSPDNNNHCTPEISSVINSEDHSTCLPPLPPVVLANPTLPSMVPPPNSSLPSGTPPNPTLPSVTPPNPTLPSTVSTNSALLSVTPPNTALPSTVPPNSALPSITSPNPALPSMASSNSGLPSLMSPDTALHPVSSSNSTLLSVGSSNAVPSSVLVASPSSPQNLPKVTQIKVEQNADDDAVPVTDYSSTQCYEEVKIAAALDRHLLYPQNGVKTESLPNIGNIF